MTEPATLYALADDVLEVVIDLCGYTPDETGIYQFRRAIYEENPTYGTEFRFIGSLGSGGKLHFHSRAFRWATPKSANIDHRLYVSCYLEDRTSEREVAITAANERLSKIADKYAEAITA